VTGRLSGISNFSDFSDQPFNTWRNSSPLAPIIYHSSPVPVVPNSERMEPTCCEIHLTCLPIEPAASPNPACLPVPLSVSCCGTLMRYLLSLLIMGTCSISILMPLLVSSIGSALSCFMGYLGSRAVGCSPILM